jgi:plastocyanin
VPDQTLRVSPDGALADAIVFVADAPSEPPPPEPTSVSLDQQRCSFLPAVVAARAGTRLEIHNSDPLVHNVRATSPAGGNWINVAMPLEGMKLDRALPDAAGTWKVHCDVHPWMRGALRTFEHPYFAATDTRGRFRLSPALSGKHKIGVWHPRFPEQVLQIDIPSGGTAQLEASWPADQLLPR